MATIKLSIAMATYNGAEYLPERPKSFVEQGRIPDELVVCDDGSTDDSIKLLPDFAQSAPFAVRIVQNETNKTNLGHEINFGKAIDLCTGDTIFLADQNGLWNREKFSVVDPMLIADPSATQ